MIDYRLLLVYLDVYISSLDSNSSLCSKGDSIRRRRRYTNTKHDIKVRARQREHQWREYDGKAGSIYARCCTTCCLEHVSRLAATHAAERSSLMVCPKASRPCYTRSWRTLGNLYPRATRVALRRCLYQLTNQQEHLTHHSTNVLPCPNLANQSRNDGRVDRGASRGR
ncbi:hypothetical protein BDN71DRAFT_388886 [Pleurotus eryngii]|uniref:Uncharacterized protein n=1 Tax=Pleurotus eryngii TaxID=5323 RepID=A0A9P6A256_PLEER|nr:hypothetical protein BDN71DRAFT_388886 [Pleurotus eryngii]